MRISDWSSDVCSSDLQLWLGHVTQQTNNRIGRLTNDFLRFERAVVGQASGDLATIRRHAHHHFATTKTALDQFHAHRQQTFIALRQRRHRPRVQHQRVTGLQMRSEEHTSELQSLMRISYAVFCLKNKKNITPNTTTT